MNTNVDLINGKGSINNELAQLLNNKASIGNLRPYIGDDNRSYVTNLKTGGNPGIDSDWITQSITTNATLRRDEWKQLDAALIQVARARLGGVQDLIDKGLTFKLGNAMGTTVLETHTVGDAMEASLTMDGITRSRNDRPEFGTEYLPIPILHVDYEINLRVLEASRSLGAALDTTSAEMATRRILEYQEDMLFTNMTYPFGGGTIYSYVNHPDRNTVNLAVNWDAGACTAALILADVQNMKQTSMDNLHYGPWMLYIPSAYETVMDLDYQTGAVNGQTIRERLLKIGNIQGIKVIDRLPANNVLLVQMTSNVVRLVDGLGLQNIQWKEEGNFITKFKTLAIQVPQIRSDYNNKSGIVHMA